jgi:sulfur carrier protein ThiS
MLFPSYFTIKDIQAQSMNENIFLMKWEDNLSQERIDATISKIREYRQNESDYPKIIKEIITNADIVLQGILGLHVNIMERTHVKLEDLIPVGINPVTGRRFKDEALERELQRGREASIRLRSQMVTVEDLLNDRKLPEQEIVITWAKINEPIIEKFKQEVQKKADSQVSLKQDYIYIKNNLVRAPFALRDDIMKPAVRKAFEGIYKTLLATIIKQNLKAEKSKKRQREEQEQIRVNRARIVSNKPVEDEDEEFEQQHTKSYLKEQQKRETKRALDKATRAANRNAYMMKKQRVSNDQEEKEEQEAKDLINKVQNNEQWWNEMDTTE